MPHSSRSARTPIDDLTFDVITVLQAKARGLDAYEEYLRDAEEDDEAREVFERIRRDDEEHIRALKEVLARRLDEELGYEIEDDDDEFDDDLDDGDDSTDDLIASAVDSERTGRGESAPPEDDEEPPSEGGGDGYPRRGESSDRADRGAR